MIEIEVSYLSKLVLHLIINKIVLGFYFWSYPSNRICWRPCHKHSSTVLMFISSLWHFAGICIFLTNLKELNKHLFKSFCRISNDIIPGGYSNSSVIYKYSFRRAWSEFCRNCNCPADDHHGKSGVDCR